MTDTRPLQPEDLYRLRLITDPQISPDGSRVAFVLQTLNEEKNDSVSNIYVADLDGTVTQFTNGDKDSAPRWSPDGKWLAFVSGRKEKAQVHLLSTRGGESVALTDRKLGAGVPFWSPDSSALVFVGMVSTDPSEEEEEQNEKKDDKKPAPTKIVGRASYKLDGAGYVGNRRTHLFLIEMADRSVKQLTEGDYNNNTPAWSPDGRHLAYSSNRGERWDVSTVTDIYLIPREGGEARRLTEGGAFGNPAFSTDGSRIAIVGNEDAEEAFTPVRLFSIDRSGGDLRDEQGEWDGNLGDATLSDVVHSARAHGTALFWRDDGIYFQGTLRGEADIYRADGGTVTPVTQGRHVISDFSMAPDGSIAYTCADSTHLSEVFVRKDGADTQLTHENDAFLGEVWVERPQRLTYTGANGEESEGWLLAPHGTGAMKYPLILYIHGGPMLAYGESFFFEMQYLAGQGFGVFYPNIHGSASYGSEYQTSIRYDWGNLDYQDVLAGLDVAASQPWVDRSRIGIAGGSYGGYMTSWAIGHGDQFKAALVERCVANIVSFMGTSDHGWLWNRVFGVYPEDDVQKLWDMSPIKYAGNITTPTLVMHSERDDRTPLEQGEQYFNALRRHGVETKFIVFPEESHGLSRGGKPSRRVERLKYIAEWFKEHL